MLLRRCQKCKGWCQHEITTFGFVCVECRNFTAWAPENKFKQNNRPGEASDTEGRARGYIQRHNDTGVYAKRNKDGKSG